MSFIAHGLKCDSCNHKDAHVFYRKSNGPPACEVCGGNRSVDWSHGKFPGVSGDGIGSFTPVDMGVLGKCETREDYNRAVKVIEDRFPGHRVELEHESPSQKRDRIDTIRQRTYDYRKARNMDNKILKEITDEQNIRRDEARAEATRLNVGANKIKMTHETTTKSPVELVGSTK